MVLKIGSRGDSVVSLQEFLDITADGIFGEGTKKHVQEWQINHRLYGDGIVGPVTWDAMGLATTDASELSYLTENGLNINRHYLPEHEYKVGPIKAEYLFIHHTAGRQNPYKTINSWGRDKRGAIATEFVIGGQSVKGDNREYDGEVVQAFPEGNYGWHLGKNGSQHMHKNSVGIEVNNFGYIENGRTYAGTLVHESQIVTLDQPFKGHSKWHRYSDEQIESLKMLIQHIGERDEIDVRKGLPALIKEVGVSAFDFNKDAYYGRIKGLWTHTNTRKDKSDMFPQQELLDMLVSL